MTHDRQRKPEAPPNLEVQTGIRAPDLDSASAGLTRVARRAAAVELSKRLPWSPADVEYVLEMGDSLELPLAASVAGLVAGARANHPPGELLVQFHRGRNKAEEEAAPQTFAARLAGWLERKGILGR